MKVWISFFAGCLLNTDCNFNSVMVEVNRDQYIEDAFINRLVSSHIWTRLLENRSLNLNTMYGQALALNIAAIQTNLLKSVSIEDKPLEVDTSKKCYFGGLNSHMMDVPSMKCYSSLMRKKEPLH